MLKHNIVSRKIYISGVYYNRRLFDVYSSPYYIWRYDEPHFYIIGSGTYAPYGWTCTSRTFSSLGSSHVLPEFSRLMCRKVWPNQISAPKSLLVEFGRNWPTLGEAFSER